MGKIEGKKESKTNLIAWLKRIGWLGFLFFLIKGLIWIAIFTGLVDYFIS